MAIKPLIALATASTLALSACATPIAPVAGPHGRYAGSIGGAPVTANPSPYSAALVCLGEYARANHVLSPRLAVGRISDYTGKEETDGSGRKITQGASLFATTAFMKAGARLVERYDTSIAEMELKYANNKLISDSPNPVIGQPNEYRKIYAGQVEGSDFYLVGGITELNFNIRSTGSDGSIGDADATGLKGAFHHRVFVMNIAMDLRLVDTRSLEIVDGVSYQKQLIGKEVGLGIFDFLNGNIFDLSGGQSGLEPVQLAVRSIVERSIVEMMANLYGMPGPQACMSVDPIGAGSTVGMTGGYIPAYNNLGTNNAQTRDKPNRWNADRDSAARSVVRGRY